MKLLKHLLSCFPLPLGGGTGIFPFRGWGTITDLRKFSEISKNHDFSMSKIGAEPRKLKNMKSL